MRPLDRKLLRDLWHIKGQALAIALVMGCGIGLFVMMLGLIDSLEATRDAYYDRYRFADVFAGAKRAPEGVAEQLEAIPSVRTVATRIVMDVTLDVPGLTEPATGRLISLPERGPPLLNDLVMRQGRSVAPGRADEVVLSEPFAEANQLALGDRFAATINGRKRTLVVVGVALSPEYVYAIAPGALMPDNRRYGVLWLGRDTLAAAFDLDGAFNSVSLALSREASVASVIEAVDRLLAPYGGLGAYSRADQLSNWFLAGEIDQLRTFARILPTIFLAVATFLLNMILSRLIATERDQIGLLKAFGYSDLSVAWHYLKLVLALAGLGLALGLATGLWLGRLNTALYTEFYRFPFLFYRPSPAVFVAAAAISVAAATLGALSAVRRAVALAPADAMRPAAPPLYRRGLALGGLSRMLDQPSRMILRHLLRWPVRSALTGLGIALALGLLISSLHWVDAIEKLVDDYFFQTMRQDVTVTLVEPRATKVLTDFRHLPGVLAVEPFRAVSAKLRHGHRERREAIQGLVAEPRLSRVLDSQGRPVSLPEDGLLLSTAMAGLLQALPGDRVTIEVLEGRRPVAEVTVAALFESHLGTPVYMHRAALNRLMGEGPAVSGAHLAIDRTQEPILHRQLKDTPAVAGVMLRGAAIRGFQETLAETLNIVIFFYILFGGLLVFGVVYNSARIGLSERGRDLASLRVLGFTRFEVSYILLGELILLTLLALPAGCLIGYGLSWLISSSLENEVYRLPMIIERSTYGLSIAVTLAATLVTCAIVRRRLDRLDLIAVLKTRE
jgi:putative ABC transport system permease protein